MFLPPKPNTESNKTLGNVGYVYNPHCGDAWVFAYVQTHKIEYIEYEQFSVSQSYFNKNVKKEILSKIMKCLTVEMYTKVVVIFL